MNAVTYHISDDIAVIRLDDGKANVMSPAVLNSLKAALAEAANRARVSVLLGRPGIFSAGFDLNTLRQGADAARSMLAAGVELILQTLEHPHPLIAGCNGHAYPMGAFLLLGADIRIAASGPWRIGLNEVAIGIDVPDFALDLAASRLNPPAWHAIATGRMYSPNEAVAAGYIDDVVEPEHVEQRCLEVAERLKALDSTSTRSTRQRMRAPTAARMRAHLQNLQAPAH